MKLIIYIVLFNIIFGQEIIFKSKIGSNNIFGKELYKSALKNHFRITNLNNNKFVISNEIDGTLKIISNKNKVINTVQLNNFFKIWEMSSILLEVDSNENIYCFYLVYGQLKKAVKFNNNLIILKTYEIGKDLNDKSVTNVYINDDKIYLKTKDFIFNPGKNDKDNIYVFDNELEFLYKTNQYIFNKGYVYEPSLNKDGDFSIVFKELNSNSNGDLKIEKINKKNNYLTSKLWQYCGKSSNHIFFTKNTDILTVKGTKQNTFSLEKDINKLKSQGYMLDFNNISISQNGNVYILGYNDTKQSPLKRERYKLENLYYSIIKLN